IHQHHFIALLLESLASLRAGVVKLGRLPNHDRPRADHQNLLYVISTRHELALLICGCSNWLSFGFELELPRFERARLQPCRRPSPWAARLKPCPFKAPVCKTIQGVRNRELRMVRCRAPRHRGQTVPRKLPRDVRRFPDPPPFGSPFGLTPHIRYEPGMASPSGDRHVWTISSLAGNLLGQLRQISKS